MIRPVRQSEIGALADLAARTYAHAFGDEYTPEQLRREMETNRSVAYFEGALKRGNLILVDVERGRLRGYTKIGGDIFPEFEPQPGDHFLTRLYVDPDCQGQGIGRALLEAALAHPRMAEAKRVYLQVRSTNARALKLYRAAGFEIVGNTRLGVGELADKPDFIMMRPSSLIHSADRTQLGQPAQRARAKVTITEANNDAD
jgi:ribosomal protein S18 acetylase RimI-like enzyme